MNHPLWPVVREAARRIVRLENLTIYANEKFEDSINQLSSKISDYIPQRTNFPKHVLSKKDTIQIYQKTDSINKIIIEISMNEPDIEICWVQMTEEAGFSAIIESCLQLLEAGYPGCIGCDDSNQEERWNERKFRDSLA